MSDSFDARLSRVPRIFLVVGASVFWLVTRVRNLLFDLNVFKGFRSRLPVLCVGNITVGGTGKTPLVRYLVDLLRAQGEIPVVLSRGYGGRIAGPRLVKPDDSFVDVGDEPLMLAQDSQLPVVIARSRVDGATFIQDNQLGSVIVLDDGFQHRWLHRDVNIVCVNAATPESCRAFVEGNLLPLGTFRESKAAALKRASLLVLSSRTPEKLDTGAPAISEIVSRLPPGLPCATTWLGDPVVQHGVTGEVLPIQEVVALCAIANPDAFFRSLESIGFTRRRDISLPDHSAEMEVIFRATLKETQLPIVITEKDAIRLPRSVLADERTYLLRFGLKVESSELLTAVVKKGIACSRGLL